MAHEDAPTVVIGVDDPAMWRGIEAAVLAAGGQVAGDATDGQTLLALCAILQPHVVVVDPAIGHELGTTLLDRLLDTVADVQLVVLEPAVAARDLDPRRVRLVARDDAHALEGALAVAVHSEARVSGA